jgi:hypothetical protein
LQGIQGEQGIPGLGINFKGALPTEDDLPDGALQGDLYIVEDPAPAHGWVWDEAESAYVDAGPVQGPQGIEGPQGIQGEAGPAGSDGAAGAQGVAGQDGAVGPAGPQGETGVAGKDGAPGPAGADGAKGDIGPAGPTAVSADEGNASVLGSDGLLFTPASTGGGVSADEGNILIAGTDGLPFSRISADDDNTLTFGSGGGLYVSNRILYNDFTVNTGPISGDDCFPVSRGAPAADGVEQAIAGGRVGPTEGLSWSDLLRQLRTDLPVGGTGTAYTLPVATASVLGGVKVGTGLAVDGTGTLSATAATGFLPTAGGDMTGTITLPSGSVGLAVKGTNYNMLGGSGGVAFRSGTSNIVNHTGAEITNYVPLTTPGTGVGVRFGSGGPNLSKSPTGAIASSAQITVAAAPVAPTELANKAYVDSVAGGGGVTNPVAGSVAGLTLWLGSQSEYDAIGSKSESTLYYIK